MELLQSSTLKALFDPPGGNLTEGLENVQFENLCPGGMTDLFLQLRRRSNLLTTAHIAHACHFVSLANRIKREGEKLKETPDKKRSHRLMAEVRQEPGLRIGIIGVGRLGHLLANYLIRYGDVYPQELFLSSRQADLLSDLIQKGVGFCKFNNIYLVEQCDIVFLCVAPQHLRYIIDDLHGRIKPHVLIYSLVLGYPALKLATLLQHKRILKPSFQWNDQIDQNVSLWPASDDVERIFGDETLMKRISVESADHDENLINDPEFIPTMFYALLNVLKHQVSLNRIQSLRVLSALLFKHPHNDLIIDTFAQVNLDEDHEEFFPDFDLVHLTEQTKLMRDLLDNHLNLRQLFSDTFISHFTVLKSNH